MPPKRATLVLGISVAVVYFLLDYWLNARFQSDMLATVLLFDFSSVLYSAIQYARGFPLLKYDFTLWGEGAHLYHSIFVRLFGENGLSIKLAMATAGAGIGALAYGTLRRLTERRWISAFLSLLLWGSLTAWAFGFGQGYAAYYVFALSILCLYLGTFYFRDENRENKGHLYPFLFGLIGGVAYGFKYELAAVLIFTYTIVLIWDEMRFPSKRDKGIPFGSAWPTLMALGILLITLYAFKKNFFFVAALPLGFSVVTLALLDVSAVRIGFSALSKVACMWLGVATVVGAWVARLASYTDWNFAVAHYFPFNKIDEQIRMMAAHGAFYDDPWRIFNRFFGMTSAGVDDLIYIALLAIMAMTAFLLMRKRVESQRVKLLVLAGFPAAALLAQAQFSFAPPALRQFLYFAPMLHVLFFAASKTMREDRTLNWLNLVSAGMLCIYLRESNCLAYDTWGILMPVVALYTYSGTKYVLNSEFSFGSTSVVGNMRGATLVLMFLLFMQGLYFELASNLVWHVRYSPPFNGKRYHYSPRLRLYFDEGPDLFIQEFHSFFKSNLRPEETIFVFSGPRLPYVLANRNTGTVLRMPYFVASNSDDEERILHYLKENLQRIPYVVDSMDEATVFSGTRIRMAFPKLAKFIDEHYQGTRRIGLFRILQRNDLGKDVLFNEASGKLE